MAKAFKMFAAFGFALALTACGAEPKSALPVSDQTVVQGGPVQILSPESGLSIRNAYIKPPLPGRDVSAIYFTLTGGTTEDRLIGVKTSLSDLAEIHTHIKDGDIMKMRRIDGIDVPAKGSVVFEPGGYHIMVFGTELSPVATDGELTLSFENAGDTLVRVGVLGRRDLSKVSADE